MSPSERWSGIAFGVGPVAIVLAVTLVLAPITPRITFNDGLGYDGRDYAAMTAALRGEPHGPVLGMHRNRLAPPAIVAATGLDVRDGFLLLDLLSDGVSAVLLYLLLLRYGGRRGMALLGVLWWAVLPQGPRHDLYYPARVDAFAFMLLLGLLHAALSDRLMPFAALLPLAVLSRENLLAVAPIVWIRTYASGALRATTRIALVVLPALAIFALVRLFPIRFESPPVDVSVPAIIQQSLGLLPITWKRILLAFPVTLGLFALVPLASARATIDLLRRERWWIYYVVFTLVFVVVTGIDWDRNYYLLVPLGAVLTFALPGRDRLFAGATGILLTVIHLGLTRVWLPVRPDEASYSGYVVGLMDLTTATFMTVASLLAFALAWVVVRMGSRPMARPPA